MKLTNVDILHQVREELNIEKWIHEDRFREFIHKHGVVFKEIDGFIFYLDTNITEELKLKGTARELVRQIQQLRKEKGCIIDEHIAATLPKQYETFPDELIAYIKKKL